jgi:hypothetical protein
MSIAILRSSYSLAGVVITRLSLTLAVTCLPATAFAQHVHNGKSGLPHGVPDFCAAPTIRSVASGNWSSPSTWNPARVPGANDKVVVGSGNNVTYDAVSDASLDCVSIEGALRFRNNASTRIKVGNLMVKDSGVLEVGTAASPIPGGVTAEIIIADRPLNTGTDPEQYGTGFIGFGRVTMHGAIKSPTFTRLTSEPMAGATTLNLSEVPAGWSVGDKVLIPDTRQLKHSEYSTYGNFNKSWDAQAQWEERTISQISGSQVVLSQALSFNHKGARALDGTLDFLPHVGNLSRTVVVRSENPNGTRGHGLFSQRADVDIRYVAFRNMGRTSVQPLDSTTFSGDTPTHIGTNQIGRYPIHMHHVMGPTTPPSSGYQFVLMGNAIEETTKWALTLHNSHFGLVQQNVVFKSGGSCIMTEDGSESRNVIDRNFAVGSWGSGGRTGEGREGGGFWFRGVDNIVTNNVAANIMSDGADSAYGYKYFPYFLGNVRIPKAPGADTMDNAQVDVKDSNAMAVRQFDNNEVYGATESGLTYWWIGSAEMNPRLNAPESVFSRLKAWHIHNKGIFNYAANNVTIESMVMRSDEATGMGIEFSDYYARNITIRRANIQGRINGINGTPNTGGGTILIEDSVLLNQANLRISMLGTVSASAEELGERRWVVRNSKLTPMNRVTADPWGEIVLHYSDTPTHAVTRLDSIMVQDHNGVVGDNFLVFYTQQAANFIVPVSLFNQDGSRRVIGAPVGGLTNAQAWSQYQVAVGGAVAPCTTTRNMITNGYACPWTGTLPAAPRNVRIVASQ